MNGNLTNRYAIIVLLSVFVYRHQYYHERAHKNIDIGIVKSSGSTPGDVIK